MRGVYVVTQSIASVTTAKTLLQVKAGAATPIRIIRAWVSNSTVDTDDRGEIQLLLKSSAATVTSLTPILTSPTDQAAKAVGGTSATGHTATSEGTDSDIYVQEGFSVLGGWGWLPTPKEYVEIAGGAVVALLSAVTLTSVTLVCGIVFEELA